MHADFLINVCLTNGDIFARKYATRAAAVVAFRKLVDNELVVYASLHDEQDNEIAAIDHSRR